MIKKNQIHRNFFTAYHAYLQRRVKSMSKEKQDRFLSLYKPVHERFERFCRSRVYGEMDFKDVMNESLLIAYDKLDSLRSEKAFLSFLFSICVRVISNIRQKKTPERYNSEKEYLHPVAEDNPSMQMDVQILLTRLKQLPDEQRECILLFEISGFSLKEIAEIQGVSEGAVKQRLRRGRAKLTELMNDVLVQKNVDYEK